MNKLRKRKVINNKNFNPPKNYIIFLLIDQQIYQKKYYHLNNQNKQEILAINILIA